jgi:hypothetical protein
MRGRFVLFTVLACACLVSAAQAEDYYIPQVANGSFENGSFRTTFVLFNVNNVPAVVEIDLVQGPDGQPFSVTIPGLGTADHFTLNLPAGASRILQTDGSGPLAAGAAHITASAGIGVSAIFSVFDSSGNFLTEAGVGSSEALTDFVIPVDVSASFNTGIGLYNPGSDTASLTLILMDTTGQEVGRAPLTLNPGGHTAQFVTQLFPATSGLRGTLRVTSPVPVTAVGLRQNNPPLSYTSLPAFSHASVRKTFSLAQVANGTFDGGSFQTTFLLFNISSSATTVTLSLTKDNGTPFPVNIPGTGNNSTFTFQLAPGASVFLQTDGLGPLSAGAASITSTQPIGAAAVFTVLDSQGHFQTEAGVGDSVPFDQLTLPVDVTGSFNTGVAFFNPNSGSISVTMKLLDQSGLVVSTAAPLTLPAKNHTAQFATQLFPGTSEFRGSIAITATGGTVAALTLRQHAGPLSYTTLPVAEGASQGSGTQPSSSILLRKQVAGYNGTSDSTLNQTLQNGFKITGTISGPGKGDSIVARNGSDIFTGVIDDSTGKYVIVVPAGTYTLVVCFAPTGSTSDAQVTSSYSDPSSVQVSADTTHNITLPARQLSGISGTISGVSSLAMAFTRTIAFTSLDNSNGGAFTVGSDWTYSGKLPDGNYTASIEVVNIGGAAGFEYVNVYNIGSAVVSGSTVTANFTVPDLGQLSGTVSITGSSLPQSTLVTATDKTAPLPAGYVCCVAPTTTLALAGDTGAYQMRLAAGRSYDVTVMIPVGSSQSPDGAAYYPLSGTSTAVSANTTLDLNLPALPGQAIVTGKVSNGSGQGVKDVVVTATSRELSSAANLGYTGSANTDASGNYRLVLLKGVNYEITFTPPAPTP